MTVNLLPGLDVSRETMTKLSAFATLVEKWTKSINLIAASSKAELWNRHVLDSAQIIRLAPDNWRTWTDLGSGAGFPGIVIAILDSKKRPIRLVESDTRKAIFLRTVKRELDINLEVHNERISKVQISPADVLSARALSPLPDLLSYTETLLSPDGTALFMKGRRYQEELDQAKKNWHFDLRLTPSITSEDSRILNISRILRREC